MHRRVLALILAFILIGAVAPASAAAHGKAKTSKSRGAERRLHAREVGTLGARHAAEHAFDRKRIRKARRRWRRMTPGQRKRLKRKLRRRHRRQQATMTRAAGTPDHVGQWTSAPFNIPNFAIHAALLPTGKVLFWGYPPLPGQGRPRPNAGEAAIWDPALGEGPDSMKRVPPPLIDGLGRPSNLPNPLDCSGQTMLPSGEVLLTGGNNWWPETSETDEYLDYTGSKTVFTFDPWQERWITQPLMEHGRWYPSQVELGDGSTLTLSGYTEEPPGGAVNDQLEIFTPSYPGGQGTISRLPSGDRETSLYPHLFTMPSGNVLMAGPGASDTALLRTNNFTWKDVPDASHTRVGGNAVLIPGGTLGSDTVTEIGGYGTSDGPGDPSYTATNTTETIDLGTASPSFQAGAPQNIPRSYGNTVLLPDASMVTIGGGQGFEKDGRGNWWAYDDGRSRAVEVFNHDDTEFPSQWQQGPPQQEDRAYHSTAVLLPDGRVWSAGDDYAVAGPNQEFSSHDTAEIYSPPYLYKGNRPVISNAPEEVDYGQSFDIGSASPDVHHAVLVAPAATTHAADMQQRVVPLLTESRTDGTEITVESPGNGNVAPPGYYMLFLMNRFGVPSVAKWVRIGPPLPEAPPAAPGGTPGAPLAAELGAGPKIGARLIQSRNLRRRGKLKIKVSSDLAASITTTATFRRRKRTQSAAATWSQAHGVVLPHKLKFRAGKKRIRIKPGQKIRIKIEAVGPGGRRTTVTTNVALRRKSRAVALNLTG